MQYALVNVEKREPTPGAVGKCETCDHLMISKCGEIKLWHWAHKGKRHCDRWWEPETPWHRGWKNQFPAEWREVRQYDVAGECHVADVRTEHGLVIECQYSSISSAERIAREKFYGANGRMVWIVNLGRYKTARSRLAKGQADWGRTNIQGFSLIAWPDECFPKAWISSTVPVFFDFEDNSSEFWQVANRSLWCLLPGRAEGNAVVARVSWAQFVELARSSGEFVALNGTVERIAAVIRLRRQAEFRRAQPVPTWRRIADYRRRNRRPF